MSALPNCTCAKCSAWSEAIFSSVYGLGAGLFFIGYFIFEVPSNLILQRVGARIWIARIMIVWGIVSMAFMFLKGTTMFYTMRFLLGAAEAGFFPGVILYLTYWFPAKERARTVALFATGGVLAGVIGSPISGALLELNGVGGLAGWQWLFLLEGIPAVLMGFVVLLVLPNRPHDARWLSPAQKEWIQGRLDAEDTARPSRGPPRAGRDLHQRTRLAALPALLPDERGRLRLRTLAALHHQELFHHQLLRARHHQCHSLFRRRRGHDPGGAVFRPNR